MYSHSNSCPILTNTLLPHLFHNKCVFHTLFSFHKNALKEYLLIRAPVELAVLGKDVEKIVDMIRMLGNHVLLREDWQTSHIILNDASIRNNPFSLWVVFQAMAYVGVEYFSFCMHGMRWPIVSHECNGLDKDFWMWFEGCNK